jgi:hypothetical protein
MSKKPNANSRCSMMRLSMRARDHYKLKHQEFALRNFPMKRRRLRHYPPVVEDNTDEPRETETASVLNSSVTTQLDVCRCPKCNAPMTARNGRAGPYFHCQCLPKLQVHEIDRLPVAAEAKRAANEEVPTQVAPVADALGAPKSAGLLLSRIEK